MRMKTWKIIDWGGVDHNAKTVPYRCGCGREAELPVRGRLLAICGGDDVRGDGGLIFDSGAHEVPPIIQCRKCGRVKTTKNTQENQNVG